jgi:hypothetical protein
MHKKIISYSFCGFVSYYLEKKTLQQSFTNPFSSLINSGIFSFKNITKSNFNQPKSQALKGSYFTDTVSTFSENLVLQNHNSQWATPVNMHSQLPVVLGTIIILRHLNVFCIMSHVIKCVSL